MTGTLVNFAAGNLIVWHGPSLSGARYDVTAGTWVTMNNAGSPSIFTQNGESSFPAPTGLFVWGGRRQFNNRPSCYAYRYDVILEHWVNLTPPTVDYNGDCNVRTLDTHLVDLGGGRIMVLGGSDWCFSPYRQVQYTQPAIYSLTDDTWISTINNGFPPFPEFGVLTGSVVTAWENGNPIPWFYLPP